jgi:LysR family cys regulon transcriptional activator
MNDVRRRSYKDLTLPQLRSFCEVCRLGSYAAAARQLLLTTPAVWEQIQALERHYDRSLLKRSGNSVRPTPDGQQLLEMIQPLLAGLESTKSVLQQQTSGPPAALSFATHLRVLTDDISRGLARFQRQFPQVRLHIVYTGNDVDQRVAEGTADVGLSLEPGPDVPCRPTLVYEPAGQIDYLLVTPPRHPLLGRRSLHLKHILEHPLVLADAGGYSRRRVEEALHRHALAPQLVLAVETSSDEYTLSCVRAGLGVGITVGTGCGVIYRGLGVRPLRRWLGTARIGFLWRRGAHLPPATRALADAIRACVRPPRA